MPFPSGGTGTLLSSFPVSGSFRPFDVKPFHDFVRNSLLSSAFARNAIALMLILALVTGYLLTRQGNIDVDPGEREQDRVPQHRDRAKISRNNDFDSAPSNSFQFARSVAGGRISPDDAWDEVGKMGIPHSKRNAHRRFIISKVAREKGAVEALNFLNSRVGPGIQRTALLGAVFAEACNNLDEAVKALAQLEFPDEEIEAAIEGIGSSYITHDRTDFDINLIAKKAPVAVLPKLASAAIFALARQNDKDMAQRQNEAVAIYKLAVDAVTNGGGNNENLGEIYGSLVADFPMGAWSILSAYKEGAPKHLTEVSEHLISMMVSEDPSVAVGEIVKFQGKKWREYLEDAAYHTAKRNMADVNVVLSNVSGLRKAEARDSFAMGMVRYATELGDAKTAEQWAKTIADPELKSKAGKLLKH